MMGREHRTIEKRDTCEEFEGRFHEGWGGGRIIYMRLFLLIDLDGDEKSRVVDREDKCGFETYAHPPASPARPLPSERTAALRSQVGPRPRQLETRQGQVALRSTIIYCTPNKLIKQTPSLFFLCPSTPPLLTPPTLFVKNRHNQKDEQKSNWSGTSGRLKNAEATKTPPTDPFYSYNNAF